MQKYNQLAELKDMVSARQACHMLNCSVSQVYAMVKEGKLASERLGKHVLIRRENVIAWIGKLAKRKSRGRGVKHKVYGNYVFNVPARSKYAHKTHIAKLPLSVIGMFLIIVLLQVYAILF